MATFDPHRLDTAFLYKIVDAADWHSACLVGAFAGSADDHRDGFIHLSMAEQVGGTLARYYAERADIVLVAIDPAALGDALRMEPAHTRELFPHYYAPLRTAGTHIVASRQAPDEAWVAA